MLPKRVALCDTGGGTSGMTRREKLIEKMRTAPQSVRYTEIEALLRHEGFALFNQRGSHCSFHHGDGRVLTVVQPHGGHKTCHPSDVRRLLKVLEHENEP